MAETIMIALDDGQVLNLPAEETVMQVGHRGEWIVISAREVVRGMTLIRENVQVKVVDVHKDSNDPPIIRTLRVTQESVRQICRSHPGSCGCTYCRLRDGLKRSLDDWDKGGK